MKILPHAEETVKLSNKKLSKKSAKKPKSVLIVIGKYIPDKETSQKSDKKPKRLYIVPGAYTLLFQQVHHNCISIASYGWWICVRIHHQAQAKVSCGNSE